MTDLQATHGESPGGRLSLDARALVPLKVFINYRREDTEEAAVRLYERLASSLGEENVYLDVKSNCAGTDFLVQIKAQGVRGSAFLALIGRRWLTSLEQREPLRPGDATDYVELELELALNKWPGQVIPVLVGDAAMPAPASLPRPIRRLASFNAAVLRPLSFDGDVDTLIAAIGEMRPHTEAREPSPSGTRRVDPAVAPPEDDHYETVLDYMIEQGTVVPVLGAGICGTLPDAEQLAAHLARTFEIATESKDLAEVAQRVEVTVGPAFLEKAIIEALTPKPDPQNVHRVLASLPRRLREMGRPERYQMIVTVNYDSALEQAFEEEGEDYDLAVFLPHGTDEGETNRGKFLHVRSEQGEPEPIGDPSRYRGFKIDRFDELARTLIVKIHGSTEGGEGDLRWDGNCVLTEDQYIDYLVNDQIVRLVPYQILNKLTRSHCLFLGYAIRDWSRRVFLKRIWRGGALKNSSWAVQHEPDRVEKDAWKALQVELLGLAPDEYIGELDIRMRHRAARA
jgi:hypothetical protein